MHPTLKIFSRLPSPTLHLMKLIFFQQILLKRSDKYQIHYLLGQLFSFNLNLKVIEDNNIKLKAILSLRRPGRKLRSTVDLGDYQDRGFLGSWILSRSWRLSQDVGYHRILAFNIFSCMRYFQTYMHPSLFVLKELKKNGI